MVESIQHVLDRVRRPRVHITYDVEIGGAIEKKELPFVVGIIADLAAKTNVELPKLKQRKFVEIDRDNFNEVMIAIRPRLAYSVKKTFGGAAPAAAAPSKDAKDAKGGKEGKDAGKEAPKAEGSGDLLGVELEFQSIEDFNPISVVSRVPLLKEAYDKRVALNDLISRVDGNDAFNDQLSALIADQGIATKIAGEAKGDNAPETDKILTAANLLKEGIDDDTKKRLRTLVQVFAQELADIKEAPKGDIYFFVLQRVAALDKDISLQLDEVLHHEDFQRLEGSWRGLHYLVSKSETGTRLKLRFLQLSFKELAKDLQNAVEFDQSLMFKKIYEEEYGTFGGHPYSCMVLDFPFCKDAQDIEVLSKFSGVAAAAHVPTLAQADPKLFGVESFRDIGAPRDLAKVFEGSEFVKWNSFRASPDSRYVTLLLPRVLMRPPYGKETCPVDEFDYNESVDGETNEKFCWGNPAFAMAERITHSFSLYSWTAAIRGVEGGGLVEGLPTYTFKTSRGDKELKCPTEVILTDRREKELSDLGFLALCHCKGTDYAAFFGGQTSQKPKKYNTDDANANALVSARLPYILNASRFAHYVKAIMRDKIGSFMSRGDVQSFLQNWLGDYVLLSDMGSQEAKSKYPLREGRVVVKDVPGKPGSYHAVLFLRPHFQLEELTVSLRLVAKLPDPVG
ncbi:type VI secretion system contractile sheath large subunit [bacterium NHP-B]|nr:type VI secretion system contractile sheath large subunit [bacterium NHP-B]